MLKSKSLLLSLIPILFSYAAADVATGVVEIDFVFPRNDTYAPTDLMPVVFAVQSPQTALGLDMLIQWSVLRITDNIGDTRDDFGILPSLEFNPYQNNNPFFWVDHIFNTTNIESSWLFTWMLATTNCSSLSAHFSNSSLDYSTVQGRKYIYFTTKNGASKPDLVTATNQTVCAADQSYNFNVGGVISTQEPTTGGFEGHGTACAVISPLPPTATPTPCAATINVAAASSISASLTANICAATQTLVPCPAAPTITKISGAARPYFSPESVAWLPVYLSGVFYMIVP
jgi:hypothetical protein